MNRSVALLAILAIPLIVSCGNNELSRSEAVTQLKSHFSNKDLTSTLTVADENGALKYGCPYEGCPDAPHENFFGTMNGWNRLMTLNKKGLVNFQLLQKTSPRTWNGYALFKVNLTGEAEKYLVKESAHEGKVNVEVKTRELKDIEILGVGAPSDTNGKKVSVVTYKVQHQSTPFGETFGQQPGTSEKTGEAYFVKYDNGWKLEQVN